MNIRPNQTGQAPSPPSSSDDEGAENAEGPQGAGARDLERAQNAQGATGGGDASTVLARVFQTVRALPTTFWIGAGVILGGITVTIYAGMGGTGLAGWLSRSNRELAEVNDPPNTHSSLINDTAAASNQTQVTADVNALGTQANLNAILQAAGYLTGEEGDEQSKERTLPVALLFSDQDCEDNVLGAIFDESDGQSAPNRTQAIEAANNATLWHSRQTVQCQVRLNQDQFEAAVGAVLTPREDGCVVRMLVDPTLIPEVQQAEVAQQLVAQAVDASLNQASNVVCTSVPDQGVIGRDMNGAQVLSAEMNLCQSDDPPTSHQRSRRDLSSEASSSEQGSSLTNVTSGQDLNMTQAQTTALQDLIQEIRQDLCPHNLTVIDGGLGAANASGSAAFQTTTAAIQRLCPNTTIIPLSQLNTTISTELLGAFGLTQLLEDVLLGALPQGIFLVMSQFREALSAMDLSGLQSLIAALVELGIPIVSTESAAWSDTLVGVTADETVAEGLVRAARTTAPPAPEAGTGTGTYVAIVVGVLLLLVPSVWMLRRQCTGSRPPNQDGNEAGDQSAGGGESIQMQALGGESDEEEPLVVEPAEAVEASGRLSPSHVIPPLQRHVPGPESGAIPKVKTSVPEKRIKSQHAKRVGGYLTTARAPYLTPSQRASASDSGGSSQRPSREGSERAESLLERLREEQGRVSSPEAVMAYENMLKELKAKLEKMQEAKAKQDKTS